MRVLRFEPLVLLMAAAGTAGAQNTITVFYQKNTTGYVWEHGMTGSTSINAHAEFKQTISVNRQVVPQPSGSFFLAWSDYRQVFTAYATRVEVTPIDYSGCVGEDVYTLNVEYTIKWPAISTSAGLGWVHYYNGLLAYALGASDDHGEISWQGSWIHSGIDTSSQTCPAWTDSGTVASGATDSYNPDGDELYGLVVDAWNNYPPPGFWSQDPTPYNATGPINVSQHWAATSGYNHAVSAGGLLIHDSRADVTWDNTMVSGGCQYTVSPKTQGFPYTGGSGSFAVAVNNGCGWSPSSDSAWIRALGASIDHGNGSVVFSVAANTGPARSGTITVAGQTYTVTQDASPNPNPPGCSYTLAPESVGMGVGAGTGSLTVFAGAGCAWAASKSAAWISFTSAVSGSGTGSVAYSVTQNTSGATRTGNLTIAGIAFPVTQAGSATPLALAPASAGPSSGSGTSGSFTFTFTDSNGWQNLKVVDVLIASALDGRHACYVAFVPSGATSGAVYLVDDAGDAGGPYTGFTLRGSGAASNSQCGISGAESSVSAAGNSLGLTLDIAFSPSFAGNKLFYLSAGDKSGANSGWQVLGAWNVPGTAPAGPWVSGMDPARSLSQFPAIYTFTFTDPNGWQDIAVANVLVASAVDGRHACYLAIVPGTASGSGAVYLVDDAGDAGGPYTGFTLPGSGTASNSQCTAGGAGSSIAASGNTLSVSLPVAFSQSFTGNQVFFLAARNNTRNSGWQAVGSVSVP